MAAFAMAIVLLIGALPATAGHGTTRAVANNPAAAAVRDRAAKVDKGVFLVANRDLADPNFRETVILIVDHGADGTRGLIVNRPTDIPFADALPEVEALQKLKDTVYVGGPVARYLVSLLVRSDQPPEDTVPVFDSVYFSHKLSALLYLLERSQPNATMRAYVGHAGWAPGQLSMELNRGDWHIATADAATIFDSDAEQVWPTLIERLEPRVLQASISGRCCPPAAQ
ncbi:MAG: YqgE/AlgH family protein [Nitrospirota bacterium]|jgi:putative transcriptional regulator